MKVFCIGLGKTGTTTFGSCMRILGYKHLNGPIKAGLALYKAGDTDKLEKLINGYDSFGDFPWPYLYKNLAKKYPDALFVLTTRKNSDEWYKSILKHSLRRGPTEGHYMAYGVYGAENFEDDMKHLYEEHNSAVREFFSGSSRLLEVSYEKGDGWEAICNFIGASVPETEFPHSNPADKNSSQEIVNRLCIQEKYGTAYRFLSYNSHENSDELYGLIIQSAQKNLEKNKTRGFKKAIKRSMRYIWYGIRLPQIITKFSMTSR